MEDKCLPPSNTFKKKIVLEQHLVWFENSLHICIVSFNKIWLFHCNIFPIFICFYFSLDKVIFIKSFAQSTVESTVTTLLSTTVHITMIFTRPSHISIYFHLAYCFPFFMVWGKPFLFSFEVPQAGVPSHSKSFKDFADV